LHMQRCKWHSSRPVGQGAAGRVGTRACCKRTCTDTHGSVSLMQRAELTSEATAGASIRPAPGQHQASRAAASPGCTSQTLACCSPRPAHCTTRQRGTPPCARHTSSVLHPSQCITR
jgi:hypothetical protein